MDEVIDFDITGGYYPATSNFPPEELWNTIKAGNNMWVRPGNRLEIAGGPVQTSATNVGARIFPSNDSRAEIGGALVSGRLPFASFLRLPGGVLLFLSELTSQQVYVNETALTGVTTSSSSGILRVAIPDGVGGYNVFDAGFDPPSLPSGNVTTPAGGVLNMTGTVMVALSAWRTVTNAISAPSNLIRVTLTAGDIVSIQLPAAVSGQDGWVFGGTETGGDQTLPLRVVRYVRIAPRGTFTATNGSPNITAGVGTFFNQDLRAGDVVTIDAASYTISAVTSQTTVTLTANFAGATGAGKTMVVTTASAEWVAGSLGELIDFDVFKPVKAAGVFEFLNRVFLWGTDGESSSAVTGPGIRLMLADNPEHVGLFGLRSLGGDILNVLPAGDERSNSMFLLTRTTLELLTLTNDVADPYRIRVNYEPGFKTARAGVFYKNVFYGFAQRPFRTRIDGNADVVFGTPVFTDMAAWNPDNVVVMVDPKNEAVLFAHYDGSANTTVIPYMEQMGVWSIPITIVGQITDWAVVGGKMYIIVLSGGNYRVQEWEAGTTGTPNPYFASQYRFSSQRWKVKGYVLTGVVSAFRIYLATYSGVPDVSIAAQASYSATFLFPTSPEIQPEVFTNLAPARGVAIRCDFFTSNLSRFDRVAMRGYPLETRR
ncbi:MAG: hypothetical protein L0Y58_22405 [Verrucomicrobia subdivision 3 bacterium]|nr:hypothetical protein [Limisphaerales bacterium]